MDGINALSHTLVTRSVNFHGHQLLKQLTTTHPKDLGPLNMKEVDYKVYKARLPEISKQPSSMRNELINFINDKCTGLFVNRENESPASVSNDDYGIKDRSDNLPPLEYFMKVMSHLKRDIFFKTVQRGDVLYVRVILHMHELLSVVKVQVAVGTTVRDLFDADIKAHLRLEDTNPEPADADDLGRWMLRTRLCVEVLEVDANDSYLLVGTKGVAIHSHLKDKVKLGKSTINNRPPILGQMEERSIKSYSQALEKLVTFNNPRSIRHLAGKFNINIYSPSSLMDSLRQKFPESEMYKSVRKSQMSRWAHKSVADGVVFFKRGQHEEAFQCLNKALQIDNENVEAFVAKGALLANFGSLEKAVENFEEALKYNPSHNNAQKYICETLVELGKQHEEENKMEEAEQSFKRCLSIKPEHAEAKEALRKINKKNEDRSNIVQDVLQDLMDIEEEFNRKRHQSSSTSKSSPNRDSPVIRQDTRDSAQDPDQIARSRTRSRSPSKSLSPLSTKMAMQEGNWHPPSTISTISSFIPSTNSAVPSHSIDGNFNYPPPGWASTSMVVGPPPSTTMITGPPNTISIVTRPPPSTSMMTPLPDPITMATVPPPQTPMVIAPSLATSLVTGQTAMTSMVNAPPSVYPNTLGYTVPPPEPATNSSTNSKSTSKEDEDYKARVDRFLKDLEGVRPSEKKDPPKKRSSKGRESRGRKKHKDSHKKRHRSSSSSSASRRSRSSSYSSSNTSSLSSSSTTSSSSSSSSNSSSSGSFVDSKKIKHKRRHKKQKKPVKKEKKKNVKNEKSTKKEPVKEKPKTKVSPVSTVDDDPIPGLESLNEKLTAYYKKVEESQREPKEKLKEKEAPTKEREKRSKEKEYLEKEKSSDNYDAVSQTLSVMKSYEQGFRLTKTKVGTDSGRPPKSIHPAFQDSDDEDVFPKANLSIPAKIKQPEPSTSSNIMGPEVTTNTKSDPKNNTFSQKSSFTSSSWSSQVLVSKKHSRSRSRDLSRSRSRSLPRSHSKSHSRSRSRIRSRSQSREYYRSNSRSFSRDRSPVFTYKRSRSRSPARSFHRSGYRDEQKHYRGKEHSHSERSGSRDRVGHFDDRFKGSRFGTGKLSNKYFGKTRGQGRFPNQRNKVFCDKKERRENRENPRDRMSPEPLSEQERNMMIETARKKLQDTIKFGTVNRKNMWEGTSDNLPGPNLQSSHPKTPSRWQSSHPKTPSRWDSSRPKTPSRWDSSRPKTPSRWDSSRPKTPSRWDSSRPKTPSRWDSSRPKTPSRWDSSRPKTPSRWESSRPKTPSRWESSRPKTPSKGFKRSRDEAFNNLSSNERTERFGKWDDVDKGKDVEPKIGNSLTEMEKFLQIAKQKKMEEMKERNKEFLKPNID